MTFLGRRRAAGSGRAAACIGLAVGCGLTLAVSSCSTSSATTAATLRTHSSYTLMQMNLCLSGVASCYASRVQYPAGVIEATARIREEHPDAVTVNEACSGDVARIGRRTGYHVRFSRVIYNDKPLPCIDPMGRGLFGDALLTEAPITSTATHAFETQAGPERRVWLCAGTRVGVEVCTAHLASHEAVEVAANGPQCMELSALLTRRAVGHTVIFGGDVNGLVSCAPPGFWTRTDRSARQDPGIQQVYGTGALRSPTTRVLPALHTDHDFLLVRAYLVKRR